MTGFENCSSTECAARPAVRVDVHRSGPVEVNMNMIAHHVVALREKRRRPARPECRLAARTAECARQIRRLAALQQNHADQNQANHNVHHDQNTA